MARDGASAGDGHLYHRWNTAQRLRRRMPSESVVSRCSLLGIGCPMLRHSLPGWFIARVYGRYLISEYSQWDTHSWEAPQWWEYCMNRIGFYLSRF
jgi:hypothetical protein